MSKPKKPAALKKVKSDPVEFDMSGYLAGLQPEKRQKMGAAFDVFNGRQIPPTTTISEDGARNWVFHMPGDTPAEQTANYVRLLNAFGSRSSDFVDTVMGQMIKLWVCANGNVQKSYNMALAVLNSVQPETELEAMLALQMIAANEGSMRCANLMVAADWVPQVQMFGNLTNKFMRTYTAQIEALSKLRRNGEQVVKYIHVHEGGQAVVAGTINQQRGAASAGSDGQPYGAEVPARSTALPCPDPARDRVPIPCDAERALQDPRGQESWSTTRQPECVEARS